MKNEGKSQFDRIIDRTNTNCLQVDARKRVFGTNEVLPMWGGRYEFFLFQAQLLMN